MQISILKQMAALVISTISLVGMSIAVNAQQQRQEEEQKQQQNQPQQQERPQRQPV
jgi:mannose/fructose/N-acetylgalactosamine-specific phosphotransferase system component IIC